MIRKALATLLLAAVSVLAVAQIPQRLELVTIEADIAGNHERLEVFNMPLDGVNQYFLSVGHLGIGDEVIQILFDPIFELFIPLGGTVAEAQETLQTLMDLYKEDPGTSIEMPGCLAFPFPDNKREMVKITRRKVLLSNLLEFSLQREGYIRATHIQKSNLKSLASGVRFYGKIHPKE